MSLGTEPFGRYAAHKDKISPTAVYQSSVERMRLVLGLLKHIESPNNPCMRAWVTRGGVASIIHRVRPTLRFRVGSSTASAMVGAGTDSQRMRMILVEFGEEGAVQCGWLGYQQQHQQNKPLA